MTGARPFSTPTTLGAGQLEIMYRGLPTKGRIELDSDELSLIEEGLRQNPDNFYLWCAKATQVGDSAAAIDCYSQALRIRPLSSHVLYNRGRKQLGTENTLMAVADLRAATFLDPDEPWKWHFLGVALYFMGRYTDAVNAFENAADAATRADEALLPFEVEWMWNCWMKAGQHDNARACLERVDSLTPVLSSEETYKTRILLYRGIISEREFIESIDRDDAVEAANQLYGLANYRYYIVGDVAGSIAALRDVLATAPNGAGWGSKMAALDLPERERECAFSTTK